MKKLLAVCGDSDSDGIPDDACFSTASYAGSIASGAPDSFSFYIKKLELKCVSNSTYTCPVNLSETVIDSSSGIEVPVTNATLDLTNILASSTSQISTYNSQTDLTNENGQTAQQIADSLLDSDEVGFIVSTGYYNQVKITYKAEAKIKGCVSAQMVPYNNNLITALYRYFDQAAQGNGNYSGNQTYCTRSALDIWSYNSGDDIYTRLANFNNGNAAEEMKFKLGDRGTFNKTGTIDNSDIAVEYDLPDPVQVTDSNSVQLGYVIDQNRLLRFETSAVDMAVETTSSTTNSAGPKYPSFFFDSTFEANTFAFVGYPGRIYGYEGKILTCDFSDFYQCNPCFFNGYRPPKSNKL